MHTRIMRLCAALAAAALFALPASASAETVVGGPIDRMTIWSAAGSPYLLAADVRITNGARLMVEPGVEIGLAPNVSTDPDQVPIIRIDGGGGIIIHGEPDKRVTVRGVGGIFADGSEAPALVTIAGADLAGSPVSVIRTRTIIASSSVTGTDIAVHIKASDVRISGTEIAHNGIGVYVVPHETFLIGGAAGPSRSGIGGYGNALAVGTDAAPASAIAIDGSSLHDNETAALYNFDDSTVIAANDWWGSASGPSETGSNSIRGPIVFEPWLSSEPELDRAPVSDPEPACCSSILFIPGLEGSRLYLGTNRLWEPNRNLDVEKLRLDGAGSSTIAGIRSGDPIDSALGMRDVYGGFMSFLDGMVADGIVSEWRPFGYDWRKPIGEVAMGTELRATSTERLMDEVEAVARRSKTGRATIVAHSNGGLVAKYLVKELESAGKSGLIDAVISVGSPFLGTPQAVASLLHGDGQSIFNGLILSAANARSLGANMPSAYSLLPSSEYFSKLAWPAVAFASSAPSRISGSYPSLISDAATLAGFVTDAAGSRGDPAASDLADPIKGNAILMAAAEAVHAVLDPYRWPSTVASWAIAGWNKPTTKGVGYSGGKRGVTAHEDVQTRYGDDTVVAPSAAYGSDHVVAEDLSNDANAGRGHASILGASTTQSAIKDIITGSAGSDEETLRRIAAIPGMTIGEPEYSSEPPTLTLSVHSPVELHIYDQKGRHTGTIPKPPELAQNDFVVGAYEENILGSSFRTTGAADGLDTYITVPDAAGERYSVEVKGVGFGPFAFEIERYKDGKSYGSAVFQSVATPLMVATTTVGGDVANGSFVPIASTTPSLHVDMDGDGAPEMEARPGGQETDMGSMMKIALGRIISSLSKRDRRFAPFLSRLASWKGSERTGKLDGAKPDDVGKTGNGGARGESSGPAGKGKAANSTPARIGHMDLKRMTGADMDRFRAALGDAMR